MKDLFSRLCIAAAVAVLSATSAMAATPIQLSIFGLNAPDEKEVTGVRFPVLYGQGEADVRGVDFGVFAFSEMDSMKGVAFSLLPAANRIRNEMVGISTGLFNWHEGQDTGINLGFANITNNVSGLNWSFLNYAQGYTVADVGAVNISQKSNFQLSFVNVTQELNGIQIGFINCAKNGFLPCFVLFNFGSESK